MATNFVDDIEDVSEDEFWIAASYVSVFKPRRPRLFRDRTNPLRELDDIDFHSRFLMNKQCFCNLLDGIELELRHATESHGGLLPIQQLVVALRFYASASFLSASLYVSKRGAY